MVMECLKAINYTGFNYHCIEDDKVKENLLLMKRKTNCNGVIIVLGALQENEDSSVIDYRHEAMPKDAELADFISYAKTIGLRVCLKPVVDYLDGTGRSHQESNKEIDGEDPLVLEWEESYTDFILHYAGIAQKYACELFFIGSANRLLEKQTEFSLRLIEKVRQIYTGNITYEAEVFRENQVEFWDKLDVLSSQGNYSIQELQKEIERVILLSIEYQKPLILTECGCMSAVGSASQPRNWKLDGEQSLNEQVVFYEKLIDIWKMHKGDIDGIGFWCWNNRRQTERAAIRDKRYYIYGKPVCNTLYMGWSEL